MMTKKDDNLKQLEFDSIRIGICSPEKILKESHGEVKKPETIDYRTYKPKEDGLYCERIFGPQKDWQCACGKYKKVRYKGVVCDKCGVEVTLSSVRRTRIGHITLAAPVSHIWYFKGTPSRIGLMLNMSARNLEKVIYFAAYVVLDPGTTELNKYQTLTEKEYREAKEMYGEDSFRVGMGAEAIRELLEEIDLEKEKNALLEELATAKSPKKGKIVKRLECVESFIKSGNRPEWMVLTVLPVIPPDLRPMVQLDGGRFATSDLNDLYRRIINRNNRLYKMLEMGTPEIIIRNEKRMLQEAVDALIDNGKRGRPVTGPGNKPLKSLSDMLKGKQGRFRQNLLGKRVDFSGRSVIVVGPELKIYQCGLPKEMALELFKPFVMRELQERHSENEKDFNAKNIFASRPDEVWDVLDDVIQDHPVLLNRAPTLHRLGIQAFEPILVEGKAIKLHPLVCTAFNADFDGDQMAVHVPLSLEAQAESRFLMLSTNNLLKPSDGGVVAVPSQDMVLGIYYLTQEREGKQDHINIYKSEDEAIIAYENKVVSLHDKIKVRVNSKIGRKDENDKLARGIIETTVGRLIFNEIIPQDLGFVDRKDPKNEFELEINNLVKKKDLKSILEKVMDIHGPEKIAVVLDDIKAMGYKYSTKAAMTVSIADMTIPESKAKLLKEADDTVEAIRKNYNRGLITEEERYKETIDTWKKTDEKLEKDLMDGLDNYNNIFMMADSGARGSNKQIKQLAGMRGLMADTTGHTIELPIKSNFREGLDVLEYFISAHGARKGLSDTALRTADSGYLTRRLVDISHDLIIKEDDCCKDLNDIPYMEVSAFMEGEETIESLKDRITGRVIAETIVDSETGEVIVEKNDCITRLTAEKVIAELKKQGRNSLKIRNVFSCRSKQGVCAHCYGVNLATGKLVGIGEAVGVIAAQSIGEPGTQLTMRTFHTGGVAGGDITQGLPRVEELFEARKPKGMAIVTEIKGEVTIKTEENERGGVKITAIVENDEMENNKKEYRIPFGARLKVQNGSKVKAGDPLTEGSIYPRDLLQIQGKEKVQDYLLKEVQRVYRLQGVEINDKHIEMIIRQMLRKMTILDAGDSKFLPSTQVDVNEFKEENEKLMAEGKNPAKGMQEILGITKAALITDSFLSGASFQETTRVLTDAAIQGKVDHLLGLKENVIIGRTIPTGTGMKKYADTKISTIIDDVEVNEEDSFITNTSDIEYEAKEFKVNSKDPQDEN